MEMQVTTAPSQACLQRQRAYNCHRVASQRHHRHIRVLNPTRSRHPASRGHAGRPLPASLATAAFAAEPGPADTQTALQHFLGWLLANGVEGVGQADSKVAVFEGNQGERGLACLKVSKSNDALFHALFRASALFRAHPVTAPGTISHLLCYQSSQAIVPER